MKKLFFLLVLLVQSAFAQAQADTLFAQAANGRLLLPHVVEKGEKLSQIAHRYGVTPEALAAENGIAFAAALAAGVQIRIPLEKTTWGDAFVIDAIPVYIRCTGHENFGVLAGSLGKTFRDLQALNPGLKQYCTAGRLVLLGYLNPNGGRLNEVIPEKDAPQSIDTLVIAPADSRPENPPPVDDAEAAFKTLTDAGVPLTEQSGPVAFFPGGSGETYYAFHNVASHGTILRLRNPANGRVVYAKVVGRLPGTKNFYKALAGVSDNARRALGCLGDARLWCEVSYAGY